MTKLIHRNVFLDVLEYLFLANPDLAVKFLRYE